MNNSFNQGIYVVQIVNFCIHLIHTLWPSSVSGKCDKFQEISEFISGNLFLVVETLCSIVMVGVNLKRAYNCYLVAAL